MSRVLVVDDEKSIRITLCEFLKNAGFEAYSACDALVAQEMVDEQDFDVIITDIIMPKVSGIEMLTKIQENYPYIQTIIMTGEPTVETAVQAVQFSANDYLTKPISKEDMLKAVRNAAKIKSLHDEKALLEKQNQLYQKNLEGIVAKRTEALQASMQSIISLLASVVEVRDPYTAGHQRRVGNLSAAIAEKMELPQSTIDIIRIIGYIHDIGKMFIPTEILSKPGKLNAIEMQMIREHPMNGYQMIKKVELPALVAETIYQHHERCNGSGYPRALDAEMIVQEAQILMVADVVEAMMSHRPYRPALGVDAALAEIKQNSGLLFNKQVVNTCLELFLKDNYTIDEVEHNISFQL